MRRLEGYKDELWMVLDEKKITVKSPRHIVFYRAANDDVIEVVWLFHDAMKVQLHLPED